MATINAKYIYISLVLAFVVFLVYSMGQLVIPFVASLILAYALHTPVEKISNFCRISQAISSWIVILLIIGIIYVLATFIFPIVKNASIMLFDRLPTLIDTACQYINEKVGAVSSILGLEKPFNTGDTLKRCLMEYGSNIPHHFKNVITTGVTLVYSVMIIVMTPIITFYMLKDWNKIENFTKRLIIKISNKRVFETLGLINSKLGLYFRGQICICAILGVIYSILLSIIGTPNPIECGVFTGILSFIPFFGPFLGAITTLSSAIGLLSNSYQYFAVVAIYLIIPIIDSNFMTPKLIGSKTGIHPVWMIFSICAMTSILGIFGIIIAIPLAVALTTTFKEIFRSLKA